jgi:hypothetical protein
MSRAERILHDCPWCSAGDEPVPNSLHAAAWEVVNGWSDAELLMEQLRRLKEEEERDETSTPRGRAVTEEQRNGGARW